MKQKNNIGVRVAIGAAFFAMALMLFQYLYIGFVLKKSAEEESRVIASHTAQEISQSIEVYFRDALTIARTYTGNFLVCKQNKLSRNTLYEILKGSLTMNTNFLAVWTMLEPGGYDNINELTGKPGQKKPIRSYGISFYLNSEGKGHEITDSMAYYQEYYTIPKKYQKPVILDPYYYNYNNNVKKYFETSLVSPVMDGDQFLGVIGIDIDLHDLQARYNNKEVYNDGFICLLSNSGEIVTHKYTRFIEKNISDYTKSDNISLPDSIKSGKAFSIESFSLFTNEKALRYFFPINIEYMAAPWYVMIEIPERKIMEKSNSIKNISLVLLLSSLILLSYLVFNIIDRRIKEKKLLDYVSKLEITDLKLKKYQGHLEELVRERTDEIKKLNEELMISNEELHSVNKRLSEQKNEITLTLEHLKKAQEQLVISEKMVSLGVLASGIAHEINNPLNFIQGGITGLETYLRDNLDEHIDNVQLLIDAVNIGVRRAANIVQSLSHYSRKDDLLRTSCDIHFIIDNCITMLDNEFRDKVKIKKNYCETPRTITGSEGKLHQVFLNILLNACQSIDKEGTITITSKLEESKIVISIDDTGCGISPENLDKVFDPFFTTKAPGIGTGLGLSVTYKIIREHNGTIGYESERGKGTRAIITLPVNHYPEPSEALYF